MEFRNDEMWSDGRYEYERLPRHRLPPREPPPDEEYRRVVNIVHRRPEEEEEEEDFHNYGDYSDPDYREYQGNVRGYSHERRSGMPYRGEDPGFRWPRGEAHMSRRPDYRENREGFRRKPFYHHPDPYLRDRSPHRRDSPFFRESPVNRKDSPHSRSGSSVSSRSYSPEKGKPYQHRKSKERTITLPLKSPKDGSPSSSSVIPSAKGTELEKGSNRMSDITPVEAGCKWSAEKMEKVTESALPEFGGPAEPYGEPPADQDANVSGNSDLFEQTPHSSRSKAITAKTKEIEEVYRQDCETFGMVVKMLIDKDPSLEKSVQFALRQNLNEIGERCIEELKTFIAEYDAEHPELA
ncbi:periphilin-1 [Discoglossus pictus]